MHVRSLVVEGYQIDPQLGRLMRGHLKHHVETGLLELKTCKTKEDGNRFHPEIYKKKIKAFWIFLLHISARHISCSIWRAKVVGWYYCENNFGLQTEHPPLLCFAKGLSLFCHAEAWAACQWKKQSTVGFPKQNDSKPTDSHEAIQMSQQFVLPYNMGMPRWQSELKEGSRLSLILTFAAYLENTFLNLYSIFGRKRPFEYEEP